MNRSLLIAFFLVSMVCANALTIERISYRTDLNLEEMRFPGSSLTVGMEYDPATVQAAIAEMQTWLQSHGHPFVRIALPELIPLSATQMELSFQIEELLSSDKTRLRFHGLRYFTDAKLRDLLLFKEDQYLALSAIPALERSILDIYNERGYLFAAVQLDSLTLEGGLTAHLGISEGKVFRLEKYYFQGNKYTRDNTLIKISGLSRMERITPKALSDAESSILRKSYITSCLIEPIDNSSLLIKITEGKMAYLEGVLGFSQRAGKTELTGSVRLQFLNLGGSDRALALNWQQTPLSSVLQLAYHESGLVNFPLSGDLAVNRTVQDSTWIKSSLSAEIYSYHAQQRYGLELALQSITPGERRPMLIEKSASRSIGAFWRLDSRDQQFAPTVGAQTNVGYRLRNSDTGLPWSNALEADHTQYLGFAKRWSLALGLHLRSLAMADTTDYVVYRMGGYNSLRGYREDEFSSWRLGWANLELRYLISPQARVYLFYDQGLLTQASGALQGNVLAPGIGLKVKTRLGILSIEYGLGYRENGFANLGSGMIHAGLEASF